MCGNKGGIIGTAALPRDWDTSLLAERIKVPSQHILINSDTKFRPLEKNILANGHLKFCSFVFYIVFDSIVYLH